MGALDQFPAQVIAGLHAQAPGNAWTCNTLQIFKNEHFLDKHMQRRHTDMIPVVSGGGCMCCVMHSIGMCTHTAPKRHVSRCSLAHRRRLTAAQQTCATCCTASGSGR